MILAGNLHKQLKNITKNKKFLVAYSGGLDSHVLLHLMSGLRSSYAIRAMYIHHGLQKEADDWLVHCRGICADLKLPFFFQNLELTKNKGESLEELARIERYKALYQNMQKDEILLTAHHQSDQAETLLLQLFRGAGVHGLAAMPMIKEFGSTNKPKLHARPLLNESRESLEDYADLHKLETIDDPSNKDESFDRNFLRQQILPALKSRWPGINQTLSRVASIQAETRQVIESVAEQQIVGIRLEKDNCLKITELLKLTCFKQNLVVRHWISQSGFRLPSERKLKHLFTDVVYARRDAQPILEWQGAEIRRFQDRLYIQKPLSTHDNSMIIRWDGIKSLPLPWLDITIRPEILESEVENVSIRFRQGGEKILIADRGITISLKNLMQEAGIPPWLRSRFPLIYVEEKLVKVVGLT